MDSSTDLELDGLQPNSDATPNANTDNMDLMATLHISEETRKIFGIPSDGVINPVDFSYEGSSLFTHDHGDTTTVAENQEDKQDSSYYTQDISWDFPEDQNMDFCADEQFHEHSYNVVGMVDEFVPLQSSEYLEIISEVNFATMLQLMEDLTLSSGRSHHLRRRQSAKLRIDMALSSSQLQNGPK